MEALAKPALAKGDQIICVGIKHKWRAQRILASGQVTRITQVLKSSIEDLDMGCGGLGTQEKWKVQVSKTFGKSSKKQEMLEIEEQNCDDTLGNEEREC